MNSNNKTTHARRERKRSDEIYKHAHLIRCNKSSSSTIIIRPSSCCFFRASLSPASLPFPFCWLEQKFSSLLFSFFFPRCNFLLFFLLFFFCCLYLSFVYLYEGEVVHTSQNDLQFFLHYLFSVVLFFFFDFFLVFFRSSNHLGMGYPFSIVRDDE